VDVSNRTSSAAEEDDSKIDEQPNRVHYSNTAHVTDNITITQPMYINQQ